MWIDLPPFLPFFLGALLLPLLPRGRARALLLLGLPVLGGLNLVGAEVGPHLEVGILGYSLTPFRVDRLSLLFGYLFHIAAFIGNLFALHLDRGDRDTVQHTSALLYAGSALGAVFAGDLITLFVFWELLALTSAFLIWARGTPASVRAGLRYLVIHVVSGVMLLAGALLLFFETGNLSFGYVGLSGTATWLIFLSFGIKAAFPPAQLAHRRLSRGNAHGNGVPERLYHQGRRLRPGPGLPRHGGPRLHRRGDDLLPHLLRRHRE